MKVFNALVNAPHSLLRLLFNAVGSLYHMSTKGTPVSHVKLPEATLAYKVYPSNVEVAKKVFSDIENSPLYKSILSEVPYAKLNNIPTFSHVRRNNGLLPIPNTLDAPFESIESRYSSRMSHTVWVLWFTDGRIEIVSPTPNRGLQQSGNMILNIIDPADPMPNHVVRATKVIIGCELVDNSLRGCRWVHYSKDAPQYS